MKGTKARAKASRAPGARKASKDRAPKDLAARLGVTKSTKAKPKVEPEARMLLEDRAGAHGREFLAVALDTARPKLRSLRWVAEAELRRGGVSERALRSVSEGGRLLKKLQALAPADLADATQLWSPDQGWLVWELEGRVIQRLGEDGCVVCQDERATYQAIPCQHRVVCQGCYGVLQGASELPPICPVCRAGLQGFKRCK